MPSLIFLPLLFMLALLPGSAAAGAAVPVQAAQARTQALGLHASYLVETDRPLSLGEAIAARNGGKFTDGDNPVLNFGIGSRPVWVHFSVHNPASMPLLRRLSIETPWLDRVEVHVRHAGNTVAAHRLGDRQVFAMRPVESRYFAIDQAFAPGVSEVFIRVETPDPMVLPLYLGSPEQARAREQKQDYSYGFLYGFLFALLAYNAMLYAGLRDSRYLLYALYLGLFLLMNASYTGHGFKWLWPGSPGWAQWSNPTLIGLFGAGGLAFALRFLDMRLCFPRVHAAVLGYLGAFSLLYLLAVLAGSQLYALLVSFTFIFLFSGVMLALGVLAVRAGSKPARYFLLAAIAAMIGAALTTLSTWGFIPFSTWTFRAVDIGMLLDATLLALALAYRFRVGQEERQRAERLALLDPLTGINNRRAFYDKITPIWNVTLRHDRNLSVILLDIDNFKRINDAHGHAVGDEALIEATRALMKSIRQQDVAARWGGEEFILLLPETDLHEAVALAERLRSAFAGIRLRHAGSEIAFTASFGVAQRGPQHNSPDELISAADACLYQSKQTGRDRVSHDLARQAA